MRRIVVFLKRYLLVDRVQCEGPLSLIHKLEEAAEVDSKSLKFCHERLRSLLTTLKVGIVTCLPTARNKRSPIDMHSLNRLLLNGVVSHYRLVKGSPNINVFLKFCSSSSCSSGMQF